MEFNSIAYIAFLFLTVVSYYSLARTYSHQKVLILVASALFYAFWSALFLFHLFAVLLVNYFGSLLLLNAKNQTNKRRILIAMIAIDLANLFLFKYSALAISTTNWFITFFGGSATFPLINLILPLAISFYTFSVISYLVDVYRDDRHRAAGLSEFLFYAVFFPHLIAGPILRKHEFFPQCGFKEFDWSNINAGVNRILLGLFQKAVIADNLSILVDYGYKHVPQLTPAETYVILVAYSFQIFFDFAGYSNIAIGSARLFGYIFPENFNIPYIAANIADFWRRWHMTLSRWIRDYIYIPLGGSKTSKTRSAINLLITMGLAGLWHGASWNFGLWGLYHGLGLVVHRVYAASTAYTKLTTTIPGRLYAGLMIVVTFHFVTFGWILFRSPDFATSINILQKLFISPALFNVSDIDSIYLWKTYGFTAMALYGLYLAIRNFTVIKQYFVDRLSARLAVYSIVIYLVLLLAPLHTDPFIYFQF